MSEFKVPKGWKLVPEEPTPAMIEAGNKAAHAGGSDLYQLKREVMNAYGAILAAAPAAPVVQAEQEPVAFTAQAAPDGLYAVLFRDNWDGQGDRYHLLARKRNGVWFADESGRDLFEYEGDEILRIWPLDANSPPANPDAALVEALERARQFIRNGIELGFIRMPDADTDDPAHETLPKIEAALSTYRAALAGKGGAQ